MMPLIPCPPAPEKADSAIGKLRNRSMRLTASDYEKLDLPAHALLRDVPLQDAFAIDLPGGGAGRTMEDLRALLPADKALEANALVAALFKLRFFLGRIFGWDDS